MGINLHQQHHEKMVHESDLINYLDKERLNNYQNYKPISTANSSALRLKIAQLADLQ